MKHLLSAGAFILALFLLANISYGQSSQTFMFTIANKTGIAISAIHVSSAGKNNWSSNLCTVYNLSDNGTYGFQWNADNNNGMVDIKFKGSNGIEYYLRNVDLKKNDIISLVTPKYTNYENEPKNNIE